MRGIAYVAVDLSSGRVLDAEQPARLDAPALAGSVIKIAALAAALESGIATARTGIPCAKETTVAGHHLVCTHPDLHRPLLPAEALAHSCNTYFTTLAARTPRSAFDRVLADLGLPPADPAAPLPAVAVGLEGIQVAPRRLLDAVAKIAQEPPRLPWKPETLKVVRDGLRDAAVHGTASALGRHGISALAKTGTVLAGGIAQGLVVGVTPAVNPRIGFAMQTAGGAGLDAAALAAARLARLPAAAESVRIGHLGADGRYSIDTVPMDDYVSRVVAGEAGAHSSPAALEALAITVRTYAEANRGRHGAEGFDLCDLTHCQVTRPATPATTHASAATRGRVLLDHGRVASVFYTASCGGHTERPSAVWRGAADPPYLPSRADDACLGAPAWSADISAGDLRKALEAGRFRGDVIRDVSVAARSSSNRVRWLRIEGMAPDEISGEDFRTLVGRVLGWQHIRSTMFDVRRTGSGFHFEGRGAGHGVGLCVVGSAALAAHGSSAAQILAEYFPGLTVGTLDGSRLASDVDVRVVLPDSDRGSEAGIRAVAERHLVDLRAVLGVPAGQVRLRFHPTVESYQRETGAPWFTAASTSGRTIDLLPLQVLSRRGIVETTIAHELVHVLTADRLTGRPLWVREGVASFYAGEYEAASPDAAPATCPDDARLRAPKTAEALRRAMAQAASCVARQLAHGASWRELR